MVQRKTRQQTRRRQQRKTRQQSRRRQQRNTRQQSRRRQQRGGSGESLTQGARFQSYHANQHGGSRDPLVGAPLDYNGVLEGALRGAAGVEKYDAHFAQAQAQRGGSRRRRRGSQRGGALAPAPVGQSYTLVETSIPKFQKGGRRNRSQRQRQRQRRNRRISRSQRGGYAPVSQASMLLEDYSKAGLPSFKSL
jgi:hypothetical protein